MINSKNLLVITDGFPDKNHHNCSFVKNYVDLVKAEFKQVFVISPQPYFPKFLSKIKLFKNFTRYSGFCAYEYENVKVFYPSFLMLPIAKYRQRRGDYFAKKCEEVIKKNHLKFDLIHTHFLFPSAYAGVKLKEKYYTPLIATAHGGDTYFEPFKSKENLQRTQEILRNLDLITVPSEFMAEKIKEINPKISGKVQIISNFVDTDFFQPQAQKERKVKKILMVGNLIESKGILKLIPTVMQLLKIRKDFLVEIIGQGFLEQKLKQQITNNDLGKFIQILGAKPHQELVKHYNNADLFFFPSQAESFGIVQIEALACGVPVVAAPNEGSKFLLKNYCGYLSKNFETDEYAELINKALNKKWDKQKMRNYIVENFSNKRIKKKLLSLYQMLVLKKIISLHNNSNFTNEFR